MTIINKCYSILNNILCLSTCGYIDRQTHRVLNVSEDWLYVNEVPQDAQLISYNKFALMLIFAN